MTAYFGWPPSGGNAGNINFNYPGPSPAIDWNGASFIEQWLDDMEPSAVDRLAALADPDGEAGQRVAAWEQTKESLKQIEEAKSMMPPKMPEMPALPNRSVSTWTYRTTTTNATNGLPPFGFTHGGSGAHVHAGSQVVF